VTADGRAKGTIRSVAELFRERSARSRRANRLSFPGRRFTCSSNRLRVKPAFPELECVDLLGEVPAVQE
jgi:hypothetical protein